MDTPWLIVFYSVAAVLGFLMLSFLGAIMWGILTIMVNGRKWAKQMRQYKSNFTNGYQEGLQRYVE